MRTIIKVQHLGQIYEETVDLQASTASRLRAAAAEYVNQKNAGLKGESRHILLSVRTLTPLI